MRGAAAARKRRVRRVREKDAERQDDDEDGASSRSTACGPRTDLDWVKLGKACAALFKAPPLGGFARGAFSTGEFQAKQQKKRKRTVACGNCDACGRDDCGRCLNCCDKPKFGGPGARRNFPPACKLPTEEAHGTQVSARAHVTHA